MVLNVSFNSSNAWISMQIASITYAIPFFIHSILIAFIHIEFAHKSSRALALNTQIEAPIKYADYECLDNKQNKIIDDLVETSSIWAWIKWRWESVTTLSCHMWNML